LITHLLLLTRGEWFKLRRRWLPWILLAIVLLVSQSFLWGFYVFYHSTDGEGTDVFIEKYQYSGDSMSIEVGCADLLGGQVDQMLQSLSEDERLLVEREISEWRPKCVDYVSGDEFISGFVMPASILTNIVLMFMTGLPFLLITILSASTLGSEYGGGTLRTMLSKGMGRWQILLAKFSICILVSVGWLVAIMLFNILSSVIASIIPPNEGVSLIVFPDGDNWWSTLSTLAKFLGKAIYATIPYIAMGAFFVVLTQSTVQGLALSIVVYISEAMVVPSLLAISERLDGIKEGFLSHNVSEWMFFGETEAEAALQGTKQADTTQAFLVILAYSVVMVVVSFWIFQRRDVAGPIGE